MFSNGMTYAQARQMTKRDVIQMFGIERTITAATSAGETARELWRLLGTTERCYRISEAEQRAVLHDNAARFYRL